MSSVQQRCQRAINTSTPSFYVLQSYPQDLRVLSSCPLVEAHVHNCLGRAWTSSHHYSGRRDLGRSLEWPVWDRVLVLYLSVEQSRRQRHSSSRSTQTWRVLTNLILNSSLYFGFRHCRGSPRHVGQWPSSYSHTSNNLSRRLPTPMYPDNADESQTMDDDPVT